MHRGHVPRAAVLIALALGCLSCGEKHPTEPELVRISGHVTNVDTRQRAPGVRVRLLDTDYADEVATGTDGAYALRIPKGSDLLLVAEDFDPQQHVWFPVINVDLPIQRADQDIDDWPVHACPVSHAPTHGSVASWDNYLANGDGANGDLFVPTSSAASSGILSVLVVQAVSNDCTLWQVDGVRFHSDTPFFPDGYVRADHIFGPSLGTPDPALGPDIMFPSTRADTDSSGWYLSFGDPAFSGTEVTLTVSDAKPGRGLAFSSPWVLPVRPGTITLALAAVIDGVPNKTVRDFLLYCGIPPVPRGAAQAE